MCGVDLFQHIVSDVFDVILHCDFGLVQLGLGGRALSGVQLLRRKNLIIYGVINQCKITIVMVCMYVCMYDEPFLILGWRLSRACHSSPSRGGQLHSTIEEP